MQYTEEEINKVADIISEIYNCPKYRLFGKYNESEENLSYFWRPMLRRIRLTKLFHNHRLRISIRRYIVGIKNARDCKRRFRKRTNS
jgi:hypothetical protein